MRPNYKIIIYSLSLCILVIKSSFAMDFESWLDSYKKYALKKGISQKTINIAFKNVKFLDQVVKWI